MLPGTNEETTVEVQQEGGFAALTQRAVVHGVNLDASQRVRLQQLINDAQFFTLPSQMMGTARPDVPVYKITVTQGSRSPHTVTTNRAESLPELFELIAFVQKQARR